MEFKKVEVEWVDSCRVFFEWTQDPEDEIAEQEEYSLVVHSIGYLAGDWSDRILLLQNNGHDQICSGIIIPKCSINKITQLEVAHGERNE